MKCRGRLGVSYIIGVILTILIVVASAVLIWAYLSGYIGAKTSPASQTSVIQINAVQVGSTPSCSVQLLNVGKDPRIVAIYVNGVATNSDLDPNFNTSSVQGTIVTFDWNGTLNIGDVVKVVCADGGAASLTAT
jgi:FlaG/FlaF family flagellin (archaellin)